MTGLGPQSAWLATWTSLLWSRRSIDRDRLECGTWSLACRSLSFALDVEAARQRLREVNAKLGDQAFATIEAAAEGFWRLL